MAHSICETEDSYRKWLTEELPKSPIQHIFPEELMPSFNPQTAQPVVQLSQSMNSLNTSSERSFNDSMVTPTPTLQASSQRQYSPPLFGSQVIHSYENSQTLQNQQPSTSGLQQRPQMQAATTSAPQETQHLPEEPLKKRRLFARRFARK